MGRSALDHLAVGGIIVAGMVEAAQTALDHAPAVTKAYPVLKLDPNIWGYVPAAFIGLAALAWAADILLRIFRPTYAQARTAVALVTQQSQPSWEIPWGWVWTVVGPVTAIALLVFGILGISRCSDRENAAAYAALAAKPEMHFAPVLRGSVTLAYVRQILQTQDAVTAERTLAPYLGTPMRVSGIVHRIEAEALYGHMVTLTGGKDVPQVYLLFDQHHDSVSSFSPAEHIAAECKVERLDAAGIGLDGCAVISDEAWTGKPGV